jgi:hypothetical protein
MEELRIKKRPAAATPRAIPPRNTAKDFKVRFMLNLLSRDSERL